LAHVAAVTEQIKLGTGVEVLPIRNAVLNARQLATVDRYSNGRLLCGVGAGWLKEEADAMGMPWDRRGRRTEEHIELLRTIWTAPGRHVEFHGEFWDLPPMDPEPRPVQQPVPILIGGHSDIAIDRAARLGDGWIAAAVSSARLAELLPTLQAALDRHDREPASVPVYVGARPGPIDLDALLQYEEVGAHAVQVTIETLDDMHRFAAEVLPGLRA
jgi:probable F420-dependent oxidoreductase